ncbi:hypothetical protein [Cellulosilyticum lentocellum]|uniref:Uncharacterized protein n=1 Tax=Cellulosilyticum lentocellum (strain ATCC 49066 / DSM 5427 / NCIMB 11756 / RHM5) TaxID=642492 RepID=F2JJ42_CELLD|nr:hypothetical protein [Cellulosilyticum lentocellum]ADZ83201.1 hypothetical protein Clole_1475 [Cellulosilyticum lentocellum DSM 5427]
MVRGFYSLNALRRKAKEIGYSIKQSEDAALYILIENESGSKSLPLELNEVEKMVLELYKSSKENLK